MAGSKQINKAKRRDPVVASYELLANMDGNPNSPAEFDDSPQEPGELFFKADEDATDADKTKISLLNFIHQELHHNTVRQVPALDAKHDNENIEVYHRVKFQGTFMDVCVFWPAREEGEHKTCVALVKLTSDDLSASSEDAGAAIISGDAAFNGNARADKFTDKNDKMKNNYWAPRWKYIVNTLRNMAYDRYEKNGVKRPEPEVIAVEEATDELADTEEAEVPYDVYSGSTGKIIRKQGAKINEIKRISGVKDIKMPAKDEDAPRPRAREMVQITITGRGRAVKKAIDLIQEVVDEWANAPRPPRDGGGYQQIDGAQSTEDQPFNNEGFGASGAVHGDHDGAADPGVWGDQAGGRAGW